MDNLHWLKELHKRLAEEGVKVPDIDFPDVDVGNSKASEVDVISMKDLLPQRMYEQLEGTPEGRVAASRMLGGIDRYITRHEGEMDSEKFLSNKCIIFSEGEYRDNCLCLSYTRNIYQLDNDQRGIASYRAWQNVDFEFGNSPRHSNIAFGARLAEDFVLPTDFYWGKNREEVFTPEWLIQLRDGGSELQDVGMDEKKVIENHRAFSPQEYVEYIAPIIAEAYHSFDFK